MFRFSQWFRALHPLQRVALIVWFWLVVGTLGRVAVGSVWSNSVVPIYLLGADRWVTGTDLYLPTWPLDVFRNPPGFAAAFVPLTWVPHRVAALVWRILSLGLFLVALNRWLRNGLPRPLTPGETGAVYLLTAVLVLPSLNNGQTNLIVTGMLLFGVTAFAEGRWAAAGAWLAFGGSIKLYPFAVGLLVASAYPRRVLPAMLLTCAAAFAFPFAFADSAYVWEQYRSFVRVIGSDDRTMAEMSRASRDLFLILRTWFAPPSIEVYRGIQLTAAAMMAGLVLLTAHRTRDSRKVGTLALALGCCWMTVLGPGTEVHTYTLLGPSAAAAVVLATSRAQRVLALVGYLFVISPIIRDMFPNGTPFHALGPQPFGGLLVLTAVVLISIGWLKTEAQPGIQAEPQRRAA